MSSCGITAGSIPYRYVTLIEVSTQQMQQSESSFIS